MLRIALRPSRLLLLSLASVHALAAGCAVYCLPPVWACAGAVLLLSSLWLHARRDALLLAADAAVGLTLDPEGRCEVRLRNGAELEGRVLDATFVSVPLVVVNLRMDGRRKRAVILLPDSADAEDLRRLRVRLKHGLRGPEAASGRL